ncbi:tRNA (adenosine(37)-N6)-threonylcarbamoyltransferase complex transferase subunit TsaD [candidate division WOR-3 bacterium]|nr:tRNA (adenosine(37)-N6)-threonylcarbamoyltransferase complex transferase subunit TsaD [candidate division WOR-3 bacterium]
MVAPAFLTLGVETSCDDTSIAILSGRKILAHVKKEQSIHSDFGGVVPELASREHIKFLLPIFDNAVKVSGVSQDEIELVAVTRGPGLIGSLLSGFVFAKTWAWVHQKPYIGVNHLEGHVYAGLLDCPDIEFPFVSLIVSGGNTMLVLVRDHGDYKLLGSTRDDAAGEAIDKVGTLIGLQYPAGAEMEKLAKRGNKDFIRFPKPNLPNYEFSYSGLKTSVLYALREMSEEKIEEQKNNIALSFLASLFESLVEKSLSAVKHFKCDRLLLTGGVAANDILYEMARIECEKIGCCVFRPRKELCGDNAAMIAYLGQFKYAKQNGSDPFHLKADPRLKFV